MFVWCQLRRQEGAWVGEVEAAIVFLPGAHLFIHWEDGPIEVEHNDGIPKPSFPNLEMLGTPHPPMLEFSELDLARAVANRYPFEVRYSASKGPLAGRTGVLVMKNHDELDDECAVMS